ncbi:MAG TPA: hypothetical protein VMI12_03960 [Puia sp.]|nr:hypothetical protein [Puia sp.]
MKTIILLLLLAMTFSFSSSAQISKGDWLLGGSVGANFGNANANSSSTSNASISPHIGFAIGKNSVLELNFSGTYYSFSGQSYNWGIAANIAYRKFFQVKNKFGLFIEFGGGFGWTKSEYSFYDSSGAISKNYNTAHTYNIGMIPGVYYQVSPGILLNASCGGIDYYYYSYNTGDWSSNISVNFLNSFTFGIDFILGKKQPHNP